ncbi:PIG-L family deacetylase [Geothrix sp. PMB-07]|uniref:PIG-L family deacetylase n=1 Tax=Geothrix sp. PMB-07 TaxID=3068640 RepID=UPI0027421D55|nr:PIG-L family deacetylase [Geothrix sp. PMB-07]WLT32715.1 PIG-L family deacetylase [Geothrix sp. PMB-07]
MLKLRHASIALLVGALPCLQAQVPVRDAAELHKQLDRLQVVGSVLYIAAHPDDENTGLLAALSKGRNLRTAYLAITRGGGGQNLIGPELGDGLAAIRTQELLAARRIDGAEQFFTSAVDFGFSKTAKESLQIWNHDLVLGEVVRTIRTFRPDVIITRFPPDERAGHGHHTASALLAIEAFKAAADPTRYPEQLKAGLRPWQATRLLWNHFRFSDDAPKPAPGSLTFEVGAYDPLLGRSYGELAAESRSQHRSQGFGVLAQRGGREESFELLAGMPAQRDLFEGVDLTWSRFKGTEKVAEALKETRNAYPVDRPGAIRPWLLRALRELRALPADLQREPLIQAKTAEVEEALRMALGLWVEAIADRQQVSPGSPLTVSVAVLPRSGEPLTLQSLRLEAVGPQGVQPLEDRSDGQSLTDNVPKKAVFTVTLPKDTRLTQPHWLGGPGAAAWAGLPESPAPFRLRVRLASPSTPAETFEVSVPVQYRFRDPVLGERYQPLAVVPPALVTLTDPVLVFEGGATKELRLKVLAGAAGATGRVRLPAPKGWRVEPAEQPFQLRQMGEEQELVFRVTPPAATASAELRPEVDAGSGFTPAHSRLKLDHPHIPLQTLLPEAKVRLERFDLKHNGHRIGYVMGAGDEIPQALRRIGYEVELLSDEALAREDLARFDAIVLGIRAYNTRPALLSLKDRLHAYVAAGGTEVVLYTVNTGFPGINAAMVTDAIGPYPFKVGRKRITDETVPVRFLQPDHPVFHWPNELTAGDFDGWIQERSLYHAEGWDAHYTPLLGMADPGEAADNGALIVAQHGKGTYVYTGLAFFRQLPDGVPGATRLFANLLALGHAHAKALAHD